jgi:hypothetical protein
MKIESTEPKPLWIKILFWLSVALMIYSGREMVLEPEA